LHRYRLIVTLNRLAVFRMLSGFRPVFRAIASRSIDFAISISRRSAARECEYTRFRAAMSLPNMMMEDSDRTDRTRYALVEEIRRNALDLAPQPYKLRLSFRRRRAFAAFKLIQRRAAYLAVNQLSVRASHCKFERHPFGVVTYDLASLQRHRKFSTPAAY
jgi:hypothetical protein